MSILSVVVSSTLESTQSSSAIVVTVDAIG